MAKKDKFNFFYISYFRQISSKKMSLKSEFICSICKLVLSNTPVTLPCTHVMCNQHLRDGTAKDSSIRCLECDQEFDVPSNGFPPNKIISSVITKDLHLSDEEKTLKYAMQTLIQQLESLQSDLKQKLSDLERINFDHFSEVRRQIDVQREELKKKIDEIALKMINLVKEKEKAYTSTMQLFILTTKPVNIEERRRILENEFRNPNLVIEEVQRLQYEHEQKISEIQARINEFDSFDTKIKSFVFKPSQETSFGNLTTEKTNESMAFTADKKIIMLDSVSNDSLATLEGHSAVISCIECIDENQFASGSYDSTIKIWDSKNFVCLQTLTGHLNGVDSLKCLHSNRLASGSKGDIKIWNLESKECLQTLDGHSSWISDFVYLPNGNLVSCSLDKTFKVWDLTRGECIQTITGHSLGVYCIVLLRNGQLASGSWDNTIKIWNIESSECFKTLQGHSSGVCRLQLLESDELVSCSFDKTIKIWNLAGSTCIRTLVGHTDCVTSIKVNRHNNTLVSCSFDGTIKTWNSKSGKCVNNIDFKKESAAITDLIFI